MQKFKLNQTGFEKGATYEGFSSYWVNLTREFSNKISVFTLLVFIGFVLSGCVRTQPDPEIKECTGNFVVDEVKGTLEYVAESALPEKFILTLKTCMRLQAIEKKLPNTFWSLSLNESSLPQDRKPLKELKGLVSGELDVFENNNTLTYLQTDDDGCVEWSEIYSYAYSKKSQWIVIDRYIRGNEHLGTCKIPLAINPWLQKIDLKKNQVVDYRSEHKDKKKEIIEKHLVREEKCEKKDKEDKLCPPKDGWQFLQKNKNNTVDIIVENLVFHPADLDSQTSALLLKKNTIKADLKYLIKDIDGILVDQLITDGTFTITPHLLHREPLLQNIKEEIQKKHKITIPETNADQYIYQKINEESWDTYTNAYFQENKLTSNPFNWEIPVKNDQASLYLYLKVSPKKDTKTAKRINFFAGIYKIGQTFSDLSERTSKNLYLDETLATKYRKKITSTKKDSVAINNVDKKQPPILAYNSDDFLNQCLENLQISPNFLISSPCIYSSTLPKEWTDNYSPSGWSIEKMFLRHSQVKNEHWLFRDIDTTVETSVLDSAGKPVKNKNITIEITDLSTGKKDLELKSTSDDNNILRFTITTRHNWYKRQRYFLKLIRFKTTGTEQLEVTKVVAINPWDYGFTHGFEVSQKIRATCLKSALSKETLQKLFTDFDDILIKNEKERQTKLTEYPITDVQEATIKNLFCYNQGYAPPEEKTSSDWKEIFYNFAYILKKVKANSIALYKEFTDQFLTVKKIPKPVSYVHLFRAVTKYPTYLINSSLGRSIYYNTRLKVSPRVVRYDDIAIGQQNKGPLRDGIYILRLMIVKNNQDKFTGRGTMAQTLEKFTWSADKANSTSGTKPLYSCDIEDPSCITLEDFIMPPSNVPVVIRDGMVKTDIPIYIDRKNLLFASSKNILVFQLLPTNPQSVICKDNTSCLAEGLKDDWEKQIDWKKTVEKIKTADLKTYDMFFHTYQTPIIPAEWTNWNITHEMQESYQTLVKKHEQIVNFNRLKQENQSLKALLNKSLESYNKEKDNSSIDYRHSHFTQYLISQVAQNQMSIEKFNQGIDNTQAQQTIAEHLNIYKQKIQESNQTSEYKTALIEHIDKLLNGEKAKKALRQKTENIQKNTTLSSEEKTAEIERINEQLKIIEEEPLIALTFLPAEILIDGQDSLANTNSNNLPMDFSESILASPSDLPSKPPKACVGVGVANSHSTDYLKQGCPPLRPQEVALLDDTQNTTEQGQKKDLSHTHIKNFATQNTLCTIGINTDEFLPKACGGFDNKVTSQVFLDDLNYQIKTINEVKKGFYEDFAFQDDMKQLSMAETFVKHSDQSLPFKEKIHGISYLSKSLTAQDLTQIIRYGSTNRNNFNDKGIIDITDDKTGSFLHALCGFWFNDFVSQKYNSLELLQDGLRQVIKESLHYQTRAFVTSFPEQPTNATEQTNYKNRLEAVIGELKQVQQFIPDGEQQEKWSQIISQLSGHLSEQQKTLTQAEVDKNTKGNIDYFHKWANKEGNLSSQFALNLENSLQDILTKTPFVRYKKNNFIYKANNSFDLSECGGGHAGDKPCFDTKQYLDWKLLINSHALGISDGLTLKERIQSIIAQNDNNLLDVIHPFKKCINNPSHFFGIEKKVIVGKIGDESKLQYSKEGGQITRLNITESFLMNTQRDQGSNQGFNTNLGIGELALLSTGVLLARRRIAQWVFRNPVLSIAATVLAFTGLKAGLGYDWRVYEGTGKRRWFSIGVVEGVELLSEYTPIEIPLQKYHECLVIRPRFNAFERGVDDSGQDISKYKNIWRKLKDQKNGRAHHMPQAIKAVYEKAGLLLCSEGEETNHLINEDYYYIYPDYTINADTSNPRSPRNRPFAISLRGKTAYERFKDSLSCEVSETKEPVKNNEKCRNTRGQYENLFSKHIEFADNLEKGFEVPKLFHTTGDFPGVYSPYIAPKDRDIKANQKWYHRVTNFFSSYMDLDLEKIIHKEPE